MCRDISIHTSFYENQSINEYARMKKMGLHNVDNLEDFKRLGVTQNISQKKGIL